MGSKAGKVLSPAGQSLWQPMARQISVVWSSTLVCGSQLSQQWCGPCLNNTLKMLYSTILGPFKRCLGTPNAKCGISPGDYLRVVPLCKHCCSDHMGRYLKCVSLPDVSALTHGQICLLAKYVYSDLHNFSVEPKCHDWLTAILVDIGDSTLFYILHTILIGPMPFYWSCSPHTTLEST
ncbi:hypothetical protein HJG60_010284 [Phyllostomus discolor]|uniref:Uncharacterized protein n=1 Tax=Phyllostomus discolor TaxID=89673 RepID=A0A834EK74_9CHIR|nr:hypothetical protein HJG60_010284 [Phyllostomus discolor]